MEQEAKAEGVLQCFRCGKNIDEGDCYADVAVTTGETPSHEDYLDWDPGFEEHLCGECWLEVRDFITNKPRPKGDANADI